jgi:hypothetical protein
MILRKILEEVIGASRSREAKVVEEHYMQSKKGYVHPDVVKLVRTVVRGFETVTWNS